MGRGQAPGTSAGDKRKHDTVVYVAIKFLRTLNGRKIPDCGDEICPAERSNLGKVCNSQMDDNFYPWAASSV